MGNKLTKAEAAAKLRRHPGSVMRMVASGILSAPPRYAPNGPVLFDEDIVEADLARLDATIAAPKVRGAAAESVSSAEIREAKGRHRAAKRKAASHVASPS